MCGIAFLNPFQKNCVCVYRKAHKVPHSIDLRRSMSAKTGEDYWVVWESDKASTVNKITVPLLFRSRDNENNTANSCDRSNM